MKRLRVLLAGAMALFGVGAGHTVAAASQSARVVAVAKSGQQTSRELPADQSGRFGDGLARGLWRDAGTPPDVWGRSRACARMVARNRAIKAGRGRR